MPAGDAWSEAEHETVCTLWKQGLSATEISKRLNGRSRNAVIGFVHRIGLPGRAAPGGKVRSLKVRPPRVCAAVRVWRSRPASPPKPKVAPPKRIVRTDDPCSLAAAALLGSADEAQRRRDGYRYRGPVL